MKVAFLDIDGVLNKVGDNETTETRMRFQSPTGFDAELVDNFVKILKAVPDVKVVLSTAWRVLGTTDAFELAFATWGIGVDIISKTPDLTSQPPAGVYKRGLEITEWLKQAKVLGYNIDEYVVIDDYKNAGFGHEGKFVLTSHKRGLTSKDVAKAINILKGESDAKERYASQSDASVDGKKAKTIRVQKTGKGKSRVSGRKNAPRA